MSLGYPGATVMQYVGWRNDLKGRTALVRDGGYNRKGEKRVLAQFDQPKDDGPVEQSDPYMSKLCFGWHNFAADQFGKLNNTNEENDCG